MGYDGEGAFTKNIPGYDRVLKEQGLSLRSIHKESKQSAAEPSKSKRPYRRKETEGGESDALPKRKPGPAPRAAEQTMMPQAPAASPVPMIEDCVRSFGLEYIQALARLLELLTTSSRERLVQFIIEARIV